MAETPHKKNENCYTIKIRVVHIITQLELGGAQANTLFTLGNLDQSKFEPVLITGKDGILVPKARSSVGVKCIFLSALRRQINPVWDLAAFFRIWLILCLEKRQNHKIIVHTHSSKAGIIGRLAAFAAGIPFIIHTVHGFGFHDYQHPIAKKIFILLEKICAKFSSRIVFVSKTNLNKAIETGILTSGTKDMIRSADDKLAEDGYGDPVKARIIRSGVDLRHFWINQSNSTDNQKKRKRRGFPLIGMVACFKPQKSPLDFLYMAARVSQDFPLARFMMIGDGELRSEIEQLAERLCLTDRLILAGWRDNLKEILPEFDVLVLTSLWEGLPRVLVEATASGIPVVATRVDGSSEIIHDGRNGYLVPPQKPLLMAEKVISILQHPDQFFCSEEDRRSILAGFDIYEMVKQQEEMYLNLAPIL